MWNQEEFVTLMIQPNVLLLSCFQQSKKDPTKVVHKAWEVKNLDCLQIEHGIIFNPTHVTEIIAEFLKKNRLKNCFVSIGLSETMVWERCCWILQEQPTSDHLCHEARTLVWNYTQLSRSESSDKKLFYLFGIAREIVFQYQLLALNVPFNCSTITSKNRALLYALSWFNRLMLPVSFSGTVEQLRDHCLTAFEGYDYKKIVEGSDNFYEFLNEEKEAAIASLGLLLLGKNYELS